MLQAGATAVDLSALLARYYAEDGYALWGTKGEQRIRCLVFESGDRLLVMLNTDWVEGWNKKFALHVQQSIQSDLHSRSLHCILAATHNHTSPFTPKPIKRCRKRHWLFQETLRLIVQAVREAYDQRRPALIRLGQGSVSSIVGNSDELDGDFDPTVYVLRVDGAYGQLIGALVNFACHPTVGFSWNPEARRYLSADFPGVMERVVQRIYGDAPVLFINGAAGDAHPATRRLSFAPHGVEGHQYDAAYAQLRWQEVDRVGRVLGGEVCKILAELEAAGHDLGLRCDRWGSVEFAKAASGQLVADADFVYRERLVELPRRKPALKECERRVAELQEQLQDVESTYRFPYPPNQKQKFLLRPSDASTPWLELMRLHSELGRWNRDLEYARTGGLSPVSAKISALSIGRDVGAVCYPGEMHHETAVKIRRASPFAVTMIFGYVTYPGEFGLDSGGYLTTASKLALGGYHAWTFDPEAETIVVNTAGELLAEARMGLSAARRSTSEGAGGVPRLSCQM